LIIFPRCGEVQDTYYVPMLHQFQYEIEDGYRRDGSPVRIGHDDATFPGYSWRGYGSYSQLQDEVLFDISVTSPSVYRLIYRYQNPNPTASIGEITVMPAEGGHGGGGENSGMEGPPIGAPQTHKVNFPPTTDGQPSFVTVSGKNGIYASPFDLGKGQWTVSTKLENSDPEAEEILLVRNLRKSTLPHFRHPPDRQQSPTLLISDCKCRDDT
jgi:laminin alpha 3/5